MYVCMYVYMCLCMCARVVLPFSSHTHIIYITHHIHITHVHIYPHKHTHNTQVTKFGLQVAKAKVIYVFRNGDKHHKGEKLVLNLKLIPTLDKVCMYVCMYACMYVCMHIYVYVCMVYMRLCVVVVA